MENKNNKEKSKNSIIIIILVLVIIGMGGFIAYDKLTAKNETIEIKSSSTNSKEVNKNTKIVKENNDNTKEECKNAVAKRTCTGTYSGKGVTSVDAMTKETKIGTIKIELTNDETYTLSKDGNVVAKGDYLIVENALPLKTGPDTCGPGMDCTPKYSEYLTISSDCSKISFGYGSYFFDPSFELTK